VTSERWTVENASMTGLQIGSEKFVSDLVQLITPSLVLGSVMRCRVFLLPIPQIGSLEESLLCAQSLDSLLLRGFRDDPCENHTQSIGYSSENGSIFPN
jgi:hypothetical protein